jgi:hypothetical protein
MTWLKDKDVRKGIVASVIASVFVLMFIQPILTWTWEIIVSSTPRVFHRLVDSVYENAAFGQRDWIVPGFVTVALGCLAVFASYSLCVLIIQLFWRSFESLRFMERLRATSTTSSILLGISIHLVGLLAMLLLATGVFADLQMNTSFNQRLAVLAAYCSDQDIKMLRAEWAQMSSRSDYLAIVDKMDSMAKPLGIKLPEILLR